MMKDTTKFPVKGIDWKTIFIVILILMVSSLPIVTSSLMSTYSIPTSGRITITTTGSLHVEGNLIKDQDGNVIVFRGAGHWKFHYDPTGWWQPLGGAVWEGQQVWNTANVQAHFAQMQTWGYNAFRIHTPGDWWLQDYVNVGSFSGSFRQVIKDVISIAEDYGIYVIFNHFSPISYQTSVNHGSGIPYAPYVYDWENPSNTALMSNIFPDKQAFIDYWSSVASELKNHPNVIFELQNEPHALNAAEVGATYTEIRDDYIDAQQKCINAIRATGAQQLIVVTWGLAIANTNQGWGSPGNISPRELIDNLVLTDSLGNLVYTGHTYKEFIPWASDYDTLKQEMNNTGFQYIASQVPFFVGEFGVNQWQSEPTLTEHMTHVQNFMAILNEWGIGYTGWNWSVLGGEDTGAGWALLATILSPTPWGQALIDAIAEGSTMVPG